MLEKLYQLFQKYPVVCTDSRKAAQGSMFFALRGDNFDGNQFAATALEQGCAVAVVDNASVATDERYVVVPDVLEALQNLATHHRKNMKAQIIGITGSNGKTTTKELISAVLNAHYNTIYTQGNLNNHIGVPLTLLRIQPQTQWAVVEMGANKPGDIAQLCQIAMPQYGIITNIGKAHLEGFGSYEGVIKTKSELYNYLENHKGQLFVNADDALLLSLITTQPIVTYGTANHANQHGKVISVAPFLEVKWKKYLIKTHLVGHYNFDNVMAAITVGASMGIPDDKIVNAIEQYVPTNHRSQLTETLNNTLMLDAYNANPSSMKAAIENFARFEADKPKMLVLGDMLELGTYATDEHCGIIEQLLHYKLNDFYLSGKHFLFAVQSFYPQLLPRTFENTNALIEHLNKNPVYQKLILIKGSRGMQLEKTVPCF